MPVEIVVNGQRAAVQNLVADGKIRTLTFDVAIDRSSWIAARILPSAHTNPVFAIVGGKPIRASTPQRRVVPRRRQSVLDAEGRGRSGPASSKPRARPTTTRGRSIGSGSRSLSARSDDSRLS